MYSFRIRFNRSPTDTIQSAANQLSVSVPDTRVSIVLSARRDDLPIQDSDQLVLVGSGYQTESEARAAGSRLQDALMVALARVRVGADFGHRAAKGMFTTHGLNWVEEQIGQRVLNDIHGLMVFQSEPKPRFASINAQMIRRASPEIFMSAFTQAISLQPQISERDLLAYTLFNASFFQPTADSRFLLLVMSIEALIEPALRSSDAQKYVESLIEQTKSSPLPVEERNSILGSLRWLRRESINQAGKRLATERLGDRVYGDRTAPEFFTHCYQMRSDLVHGNLPVPTFEDVGGAVATLEVFVSDLLTGPILGYPVQ
ncbi:conserved protein of unknown function [Methylococcus capsulatus]|uniref:Apea-like HEPN domain-containing protein n=1 Tax=Methylococcus capsulatus TaxID=414 RepID=A0AA35V574_METCP|nr:conserved protein of unknown function [Methylococcus capsulatus]